MKNNSDSNELCSEIGGIAAIIDQKGFIECCTSGFLELFNLETVEQQVKIQVLCPEISEYIRVIKSVKVLFIRVNGGARAYYQACLLEPEKKSHKRFLTIDKISHSKAISESINLLVSTESEGKDV